MAILIWKVGIKKIIKKYYVKIFRTETAKKNNYVFMHMGNYNLNNMHIYNNNNQHYKKISNFNKQNQLSYNSIVINQIHILCK
jgi:hypothetical protein